MQPRGIGHCTQCFRCISFISISRDRDYVLFCLVLIFVQTLWYLILTFPVGVAGNANSVPENDLYYIMFSKIAVEIGRGVCVVVINTSFEL